MGASPGWKVYNAKGEYVAACRDLYMAAAIIAGVGGDWWTIRWRHGRIMWREGAEGVSAGESYDQVAITVAKRLDLERGADRG